MFVVFPPRGIGAAAFAVGLLLAGCSSDSDVPPTTVSAPGGGTQANTDTGSGGNFPDVNTTPTQRPTSTIQDLAKAPNGLAAAPGGTQYGEALVGGPTSTAAPPPPPPPPPPQEALAPIPEAGVKTQTSDATPPAAAYPSSTEQAPAPQAAEAQPEPAAEPEQAAEPAPAEPQGEGQTIQGTMATQEPQPEAQPEPEAAPVVAAPEPVAPAMAAPPADAEPEQPAPVAAPQPSYGANQAAQAPEAYGVSPPQPNGQTYNGTQVAAAPAPAPSQGQTRYGGEPVGLIYFREGSSELGADDRRVIEQIAEIQRAYGGIVSVIGHASVGGAGADQQANQRISEARATAVAEELMRNGVPLDAIRAGAAGDSQPLYSEASINGEAGNRRVEVYITAY